MVRGPSAVPTIRAKGWPEDRTRTWEKHFRRDLLAQVGTVLVLKERAGFGDVGVQGFNDVAVLLLDDAAFELEGESEAAVGEAKILGEQRKALDGFVLREIGGEALDLGADQGLDPGMSDQLGVGGELDSSLGGPCRHGGDVGNEKRDDEFALVADDHGI